MVPPTDRKASSLERTPLSGALSGLDDTKSSIDRQTRTSLEHHHRQAQDRLGSMDRAEDGRRGHKTGTTAMQTGRLLCQGITKLIPIHSFKIHLTETATNVELTDAWTDHR